ncbi:MAG: hypothetical protein AAB229_05970 [Candidatus Hydrogenedentota bacterium]
METFEPVERKMTDEEGRRIVAFQKSSRLFIAFAAILAVATAALGCFIVAESEGNDAVIGGGLCFILAGLWAFATFAMVSKQKLLTDDLRNGTVLRTEESIWETQIVKARVIALTIAGRRLLLDDKLAGSPKFETGDAAEISWLPLSGYIVELKTNRK